MSASNSAPRGVAVVTGAATGIGRAIALQLAREGFDLALPLLDTADSAAASLVAELGALGAASLPLRCDLAEVEGHAETAEAIRARFGRIDVLVNNAGRGSAVRGDVLDLRPADFDAVMGVNLRGTLFLSIACARLMLAAAPAPRRRAIVTISSVSAELASPERTDYCVSKAGLSMAMKALALRLAPEGIAVFEVRPGVIRTPMTDAVAPKYDARIADGLVPAMRWGEPEDVAEAVAALASGRFAFATGSVVAVDGGLSIPRL
ncbi:3-ketoacyl-ACP reductase [Alsobacter sp. SYSU M60028]|uniref:3-ketoacyl-ACP reductase n=1 Tax=Alsobacter ponti TaxID=2962936 RepID=A0ABT1L9T6_9HYPH|nr:3-ketoacyl-ACP reductase [Alsobacter ponti]MCP8938260.1 3-ketoacyl-ACP reductase [Alsobacter ponti]